jgi:hypothetical protein
MALFKACGKLFAFYTKNLRMRIPIAVGTNIIIVVAKNGLHVDLVYYYAEGGINKFVLYSGDLCN